jgi:hypothetical protein
LDTTKVKNLNMKFSQSILEKLSLIIKKYNLKKVEQSDYYLKLCSKNLVIILVHNRLENSNVLWIGKNNDRVDKVEIDNDALRRFFCTDLVLNGVSTDIFIDNVSLFFENEGKSLLIGDLHKIDELEQFDLERSRIYTQNLIKRQVFSQADDAWAMNDYDGFIALIDQINYQKCPTSYQMKYKIAKERARLS